MKGSELNTALDFKKLTIIQLQIVLDELQNQQPEERKKLKILTAGSMIEAEIRTHEPEERETEKPLSKALIQSEKKPLLDITSKEMINVHANLYLKNVTLTPFSDPRSSVQLDEFVLFTDHILGITLT
ncbi:hypothetical protein JOC77_000464 [Peribacillus deserti]|uniref:Uncharacterized protein n=1 Tax=Peribacillus deserti TaxID=673318 RepID=A0ABS2QD42_9BACI|nr:hypothetical protein [Peribacillus deserti]MBM7691059.1 hypothetical protein [Peribacillus deserti]